MGQQFFKSGVQGNKYGCLPAHHTLLTARHDFVEAIQDQGQTFALHEKLVDLIQFVVGKFLCGSCNYQAVQIFRNVLVLDIYVFKGVRPGQQVVKIRGGILALPLHGIRG